jgi:uncharacterized membrane protein
VIINDPALALSRGYGLVAFSMEHSRHGLDRMYAHFPPLFIVLQSLVFRVFGFSALTLRALSVAADLAACVVFTLILLELYKRRIVDRIGLAVGGLLLMLEPTTLIHSREGRMESLNVMLGGLAFYACLRADRSKVFETPLWIAGAAAAGLALASHPGAIIVVAAFTLWSAFRFRHLGAMRWTLINSLPIAVLVTIWIVTYGAHAGAALAQMRQLASYAPKPSLRIAELIVNVSRGAIHEAQNSGGLALALMLAVLCIAGARLLSTRNRAPADAPAQWRTFLMRFGAIAVFQCLLVQFAVPASGMNRVIMAVYFAILCGAVALSHRGVRGRRAMVVAVSVCAVLQFGTTLAYLAQLRNSWQERSAERFDALVEAVPSDARVAAIPVLWYAFRSHNRQITMMVPTQDEDIYWRDAPDAFSDYDVVILDPQRDDYRAEFEKARVGRPVQYLFHSSGRQFMVVAMRLDLTKLPQTGARG